jgi:hypothetical protein
VSADLQTIARFSDPIEAELARSRLENEGVVAVVTGDVAFSLFGLGRGITLLVPATECERAETILSDFAKEVEAKKNPPKEAITADPPLPEMQEVPLTPEEIAAQPTFAEELTNFAFRATTLGFLVCFFIPIPQMYAILLLLYATFSGEEIRGKYSVKYYVAFVLSAGWVTALCVALLQVTSANIVIIAILFNVSVAMFLFAVLSPWKKR